MNIKCPQCGGPASQPFMEIYCKNDCSRSSQKFVFKKGYYLFIMKRASTVLYNIGPFSKTVYINNLIRSISELNDDFDETIDAYITGADCESEFNNALLDWNEQYIVDPDIYRKHSSIVHVSMDDIDSGAAKKFFNYDKDYVYNG